METVKRLIKEIGVHTLINFKDDNQSKGRLCPYFGASVKNPIWQDYKSVGEPEQALKYSIALLLLKARHKTFMGGEYHCYECNVNHFNDHAFMGVQGDFKLLHKDQLRNELEKILR